MIIYHFNNTLSKPYAFLNTSKTNALFANILFNFMILPHRVLVESISSPFPLRILLDFSKSIECGYHNYKYATKDTRRRILISQPRHAHNKDKPAPG